MPPSSSSSSPKHIVRHQHGVKGVYYGGEWLDLEDCAGKFTEIEGQCSGSGSKSGSNSCQNCPAKRSQSRNNAEEGKENEEDECVYDICLIGAGCIGAAIARELSRYCQSNSNCNSNDKDKDKSNSKYLRVLWLEAADDVSQGATKGNSGIVHAGYDDKPGTNRAKFCWSGNQMFPKLDKELRFGYQLNGSMVLAMNDSTDMEELQNLMKRGETNGVKNLQILNREEVLKREPHVNPDVVAALYSPDAGNVIPYEYTIALAENAVDNGVQLKIRREVTDIKTTNKDYVEINVRHWEPPLVASSYDTSSAVKTTTLKVPRLGFAGGIFAAVAFATGTMSADDAPLVIGVCLGMLLYYAVYVIGFFSTTKKTDRTTPLKDLVSKALPVEGTGGSTVSVDDMKVGGSGSSGILHGDTVAMETVKARFVINCAGSASDKIAQMIGDESFTIKPRLGDYLLLNRNQGKLAQHTLFPCPDPILGKGVLVQTTLWGNLILGPTARDVHKPEHRNMSSQDIQKYILSKCKALVPSFQASETIHGFCGARAKSDRGDWIIENSSVDGRMIHVAGIDSPGLAGSPAIAMEVVRLLEESGCVFKKNPKFNPQRAPIITPKLGGMRGLKVGPVGKYDSDGVDEEQMAKNIICKCEQVTELEVVRALRRSLPIDSTQAIRKRTRAGMGHCQGDPENYNCEARVKAIIARETGLPIEHVGGRPWPATSTLSQRWPNEKELESLENMKG